MPLNDVWNDIAPINSQARERIGYATQKPLALLERIIKASSNEGDVVLDPFCGCATTLEAVHKLKRCWIGIDIAIHAVKRVARVCLQDRLGLQEDRDFTIEGIPRNTEGARDLWQRDKYHFQKWAVEQVDGFVTTKRTADGGVDSRLYFDVPDNPTLQSMVIEVKDVNTIGGFIDLIVTWVAHVVALVIIVLFMFRMDPELALIGTVFFPVVVLLVGAVWWAYESRTAALRKATAKLTGILHESIFGVRVIKGFGVEKHQRSRYAPASDAIVARGMALARLDTAYTVCGESLPALAMVAVLWWGGVRTLSGDLTVGVLLAFGAWMVQLAGHTEGVLERFAWMMQARVSARRINALLAVAPVIADPPRPSVLPPVGGTLRFANVTLAFGERRVLDSLSLEVRTGEVLVLVGMSGSGKSMLLNLPPRLYYPRDGVVHLDGTDVRELPLEDLRTAVCLVSDDDMLFPDTIAANIALSLPGASRTAIEHAARLAQAHEFIKAMPEGYDAMVGERGLTLSGGQRQRIALARAGLVKSRVLLLDDASSSLDPATDAAVWGDLVKGGGRTLLVATHRRRIAALTDRVVLLDAGRVAAEGTDEELWTTMPLYRQVLSGGGAA